jgi:RNA polymerase sigma-70 factor (ECF subfamily)
VNDARNTADLDEARRRKHAGWIGEIAHGGSRAERAMEQLFHDYEGRVTGWCRYQFRLSLAEAEDLWQDVVVAIWRNASTFDTVSSAKDWIYKIARNKALDLLKRASRTNEVLSSDGSDIAEVTAAPPSQPSDIDRCVRLAYARFAREHPDKGEWILKADVLEHDIPEIAAEMARTVGATRTRLKELRKLLRPFLEPCLGLFKT